MAENQPSNGGFSATLDGVFPVYLRKMQLSELAVERGEVLHLVNSNALRSDCFTYQSANTQFRVRSDDSWGEEYENLADQGVIICGCLGTDLETEKTGRR
jgi:hypothetical protein